MNGLILGALLLPALSIHTNNNITYIPNEDFKEILEEVIVVNTKLTQLHRYLSQKAYKEENNAYTLVADVAPNY
tara:strand:+ start:130 stop:351 length:222 start_codon:yes stop_codon:yes gene_type:complete